MNAIKFETTIDESVAGVMPQLRPMLGRRVELIALAAPPVATPTRGTLDAFLARRLKRPGGTPPVSLEDMERTIAQGASGENL